MAMENSASKHKSKKFRIGVEGATTDGRVIQREWIEQMARNYDPKKYGARINIEHILGYHPESSFRAMGDVLSLETETFKDGDVEKLALVAEISPTDELVEYTKQRQKIYTSMEVSTRFSDTGEAYLTGLAVTDTPASLGTEMLEFASKAKHNPLASRKTHPDNLFSAALETPLSFEQKGESLTERIKAMFTKNTQQTEGAMEQFKQDTANALGVLADQMKEFGTQVAELKTQLAEFSNQTTDEPDTTNAGTDTNAEVEALREELSTLKKQLASQTNDFHHSPATGENPNIFVTDC